jgi:UDP-N-acetylglucosamine 2-epimerase
MCGVAISSCLGETSIAMRDTERPEAVAAGTVILVGTDKTESLTNVIVC